MDEVIRKMAKAMADYVCVNYDHNSAIYIAYAEIVIKTLTINDLELIINDKRYAEKARKMIEADSRDL